MKKAVPFLMAALISVPAIAGAMPSMMGGEAGKAGEAMPAAKAQEPVKGKVLETMDGGGYTYINLEKKDGTKGWYAIPQTPGIKVGAEVAVSPGTPMGKFTSRALKRDFDSIVFSDGLAKPDAAKDEGTAVNGKETSPGSTGAASAAEKIKVDKATGANAFTVAEVFKKRGDLDTKKISVRGKVIKVSKGIMNRNWIHIQDGTGDAAKKTHNLVCTSDFAPKVGDVVTATGILAKDKDFGGGYKYDAIIEKAEFK